MEGMSQDLMLREAIYALYGDAVDPDELIEKMGPDAADVHVPRPLGLRKMKRKTPSQIVAGPLHKQDKKLTATERKQKRDREKNLARIGLATNIVGIGAGVHALGQAATDSKLRSPARAAKYAAIGGLALQGANVAGDAIANRILAREAKIGKADPTTVIMGLHYLGRGARSRPTRMGAYSAAQYSRHQIHAARPSVKRAKREGAARTSQEMVDKLPGLRKKTIAATAAVTAAGSGYAGARSVNKSAPDITWTGEISKVDSEKRQVFGWASVTHVDGEPVVDRQNDYLPLEEIEKAAYDYVLTSRKGGDMHEREGDAPRHTADLIESVIFTPEKVEQMGLDPKSFPQLGWWLGMKVHDDEQWERVKKGERTGFSIHGKGKRTEKYL